MTNPTALTQDSQAAAQDIPMTEDLLKRLRESGAP
jgi:hypothetical protein